MPTIVRPKRQRLRAASSIASTWTEAAASV
jgi:hypothetical protein